MSDLHVHVSAHRRLYEARERGVRRARRGVKVPRLEAATQGVWPRATVKTFQKSGPAFRERLHSIYLGAREARTILYSADFFPAAEGVLFHAIPFSAT